MAVGLTIALESKEISEACSLNSNYQSLKWTYVNRASGLTFIAQRSFDSIQIIGNKNGSHFSSAIYIGKQPWFQFWEYGIGKMISSGQKEMSFSSIDANSPNKAAIFIVKTKESSHIIIGNKNETASHIIVTIKGLPAMMFAAHLWFRQSDNVFLKSTMPQGPFVPITTIELNN